MKQHADFKKIACEFAETCETSSSPRLLHVDLGVFINRNRQGVHDWQISMKKN